MEERPMCDWLPQDFTMVENSKGSSAHMVTRETYEDWTSPPGRPGSNDSLNQIIPIVIKVKDSERDDMKKRYPVRSLDLPSDSEDENERPSDEGRVKDSSSVHEYNDSSYESQPLSSSAALKNEEENGGMQDVTSGIKLETNENSEVYQEKSEIDPCMPILVHFSANKIVEECDTPPILEREERFRESRPSTSRFNCGSSGQQISGRFNKEISEIKSQSSNRAEPKRRRNSHRCPQYSGTISTTTQPPEPISPEYFDIFKTDLIESIKDMRHISKQKMSLTTFNAKVLSIALGLNINVESLPANLIQILADECDFAEIGISHLTHDREKRR